MKGKRDAGQRTNYYDGMTAKPWEERDGRGVLNGWCAHSWKNGGVFAVKKGAIRVWTTREAAHQWIRAQRKRQGRQT